MMGRDSVSSEQQLEDQQWVVESRRLKIRIRPTAAATVPLPGLPVRKVLGGWNRLEHEEPEAM